MRGATQSSSGRIIRRERVVDAMRTFRPDGDARSGVPAGFSCAGAPAPAPASPPVATSGPEQHRCAQGSSVTVFRAADGSVVHLEVRCRCGETLTVYLDPEERSA